MNNRIAKCAGLALLLVATLAAPMCAAANDWSGDRANHRYAHHERDDHAQWKWREWSKEQREVHKHADQPYSRVKSSHKNARYNPYTPGYNRYTPGYNPYTPGYNPYTPGYNPYTPYSAFNSGNYLQSGAAAVRNQLMTGYTNLQNAYANALAAGDRKGAQHYLNALKQQQKEMAQYNSTWGSTAGSISMPALPANSFANYPIYANNPSYPNSALFQNTGPGLTPYNTGQIDPRLGAATALLLMGEPMIHP